MSLVYLQSELYTVLYDELKCEFRWVSVDGNKRSDTTFEFASEAINNVHEVLGL